MNAPSWFAPSSSLSLSLSHVQHMNTVACAHGLGFTPGPDRDTRLGGFLARVSPELRAPCSRWARCWKAGSCSRERTWIRADFVDLSNKPCPKSRCLPLFPSPSLFSLCLHFLMPSVVPSCSRETCAATWTEPSCNTSCWQETLLLYRKTT